MARKKRGPTAKDLAEVASGKASSADKRELHNWARRYPSSNAARVIKKAGYKPRPRKKRSP